MSIDGTWILPKISGVSFQKGLGAVHGLSEPIGATFNTQHGSDSWANIKCRSQKYSYDIIKGWYKSNKRLI